MKGSTGNIALASLDTLFGVASTSAADTQGQRDAIEIPLNDLHPFKNHPFKVVNDSAMQELVDSIRQYGVLVPAIVRASGDGGYEILAGHRRNHACELAGIVVMPVIVRELDDDEATLCVVNTNRQRERILPSERAFAYKMMMEAIRRKAGRPQENAAQLGPNYDRHRSSTKIADETGTSSNQVKRFIRLTDLIHPLLDMVDANKLPFNTAVELSYLAADHQQIVLDLMNEHKRKPSIGQAKQLRTLQNTDTFQSKTAAELLAPTNLGKGTSKIRLPCDLLTRCLENHTREAIEAAITEALENLVQKPT